MKDHKKAAFVCSVIGTVLLWIPIALTLVTGVVGSIFAGKLLMDYLMPAELFFLVLAGWILLIVGSVFSGKWKIPVVITGVATLILLFGAQILAVVSGLASGVVPAEGMIWYLVLGMLILYDLLVIVLGILGIRLSYVVKMGR
ncbi:hypothetical protein Mlab_1106 [Methanocorpusculum labreanum Z]|uniref:Uncharacterized protein n=1 Tax=Methanocorpusculum labreanum (strain ATCC 43576 / DSM 4855 / Z) TaxID=410358 RepID=A2SSG9_METLZ|nr:hypothetical protein [Methanocorpusculum labreanum]ABN07275.1 hypothetical protein Mlab_1106 [Methanocorpusculum labreanum Z]